MLNFILFYLWSLICLFGERSYNLGYPVRFVLFSFSSFVSSFRRRLELRHIGLWKYLIFSKAETIYAAIHANSAYSSRYRRHFLELVELFLSIPVHSCILHCSCNEFYRATIKSGPLVDERGSIARCSWRKDTASRGLGVSGTCTCGID